LVVKGRKERVPGEDRVVEEPIDHRIVFVFHQGPFGLDAMILSFPKKSAST
jgi:hypothetical protein